MRPSLILLVLSILCVSLAPSFGQQAANKPKIVVVLPSERNPFWIEVRKGAEKAARALEGKAEVQITASNDQSATGQNEIFDNLLARNQVSAIVVGPADDTAIVPKIASFAKKNVSIVIMDTKLNQVALDREGITIPFFIGSNNRDGGEKAARAMVKALSKKGVKGKVLLIEGSFVHQSAIDRTEGFLDVATKEGLDVERVKGEWQQDRAREAASTRFLRSDYVGIFANNDDMAVGAVAGLRNLRITSEKWPIVIGFDATRDALDLIAKGEMYATVRQDAAAMGSESVQTAFRLISNDGAFQSTKLLDVSVVPARD